MSSKDNPPLCGFLRFWVVKNKFTASAFGLTP